MKEIIVQVDGPSRWNIIRPPTTQRSLAAMDYCWNYLWALLYRQDLWKQIPKLSGVKLGCACSTGRYCPHHMLRVLADNPKLCFDLYTSIVLKGLTKEQYNQDNTRYPEAAKALQEVWSLAGFVNQKVEDPPKETIGEVIRAMMKETEDRGTFDPDDPFLCCD